ncbi:transposase, partial [Streptococcus moroccensis]
IERLFGTSKEYHNLRYTRERGKSKMEDKVGLTLACLNIKKLVKRLAGRPFYFAQNRAITLILLIHEHVLFKSQEKTNLKMKFVFGLNILFILLN